MTIRMYGERLGHISDEQLQMALAHFHLGTLLHAEPVPFGLFGQNIFLTSTQGAYVLRGSPHYQWQFPTEQFFAQLLHERTQVPVPWPYQIDYSEDIFGWSYVLMPRMQGLQLENAEVHRQLSIQDKHAIARTLGENLAQMQTLTWPFSGNYHPEIQAVKPFEPTNKLLQPSSLAAQIKPGILTHREYILALIRGFLAEARTYNNRTTDADCVWVEMLIAQAEDALNDDFQPCFVMRDYKLGNLALTQSEGSWHVSGLFDLMEAYFGDGETDLARTTAIYIEEEDPSLSLAREFIQAYIRQKPPRPGFAERFSIYMLLDRLIIWEFVQRMNANWWDQRLSLQDWAGRYISLQAILNA